MDLNNFLTQQDDKKIKKCTKWKISRFLPDVFERKMGEKIQNVEPGL
jgi:hypothetical protein